MPVVVVEGDNPVRHRSYAVYALLLLNLAVYAYAAWQGAGAEFIDRFGFTPAAPTATTAVTSLFIHTGLVHVLGNLFWLWMFGDNVEDVLGPLLFLACFLICGVAGQHLYQAAHPRFAGRMIGSSGAVSGLIGLYVVLFPSAHFKLHLAVRYWSSGAIRTSAAAAVAIWWLEQLGLAVVAEINEVPWAKGVAYLAHLGGFAAGLTLGGLIRWMRFAAHFDRRRRRHWLFGYVSSERARRRRQPRPEVETGGTPDTRPRRRADDWE